MRGVDGPVVVRDVFPAEVVLPTGDVARSARVVITRERVLVWVTPAAPILDRAYDAAASQVPALSAPRSRPAHLDLGDGTFVHVNGQRGCGCSNPLKGWTPWRPYRKAAA